MEPIKIIIPGEPCGKGRPRFRRDGSPYTPEKTANYETLVKWKYQQAAHGASFGDAPVEMVVCAYFKIPTSASKSKREQMRGRLLLPTKKPDADNILKIIADALNGIAYHDDAQIVHADVYKCYSEEPRVEVAIWEV